ncbi:UNVERIFIED_CONTAM: hypothetical protein RMT77_016470 [Armadillidium vulgare]
MCFFIKGRSGRIGGTFVHFLLYKTDSTMNKLSILLVIVGVLYHAKCQGGRSVSRSGDLGDVNLVEFSVRGTVYGRCSYIQDGEEVDVIYEERSNELSARSFNPTILDPKTRALECREAASRAPDTTPQFRSGLSDIPFETTEQIHARLNYFQKKLAANRQYVSMLVPRFGGFNEFDPRFGFNFGNNKGYLITLGGNDTEKEFGFSLPQNNYNHATVSLGGGNMFPFPFAILKGKKK